MFDEIEIDIPCPNCDNKLRMTVKKLRTNPILHCKYCSNDILSKALNRSHDTSQPRIFRPVLFFRWSEPLREKQFFRANFDHPADSCLQLLVWLSPHLKARADPLACEYPQCLSV